MTRARLVRTEIRHTRIHPLRHHFAYRGYSWLVDLDEMPVLPWYLRPFAEFRARDRLGADPDSIRRNVEDHLAAAGIDLAGGRVLMLANGRVLGHVFDPLTVFWCHQHTGELRCVIAEVHNTYGERHRYLVHGESGAIAKEFYVSPFNPVAGTYRVSLPVPSDRLRLAIALADTDGRTMFTATVDGTVQPAGTGALVRALVAHPLETWRVSARIRIQGLRLWARGLPVIPRPSRASQEALS
ncbi:DUF1365 domain-containing protein [Nocardia inohanensis]|uniref:DUF1365 domain-containing protein n=1 Tax=Nocardia inohanensis TaxID=209246 RepID=UPI00082DE2C0|nr:DUF1365 domain-containing protein [Nocardia inohanensis]